MSLSTPRPSPGVSGTSGNSTTSAAHTTWASVTGADPEHSRRYIARWEAIEGDGGDVVGEARLIDAMAQRGARILDAGAGTGRIAAHLSALGHRVSAVDIDPQLVDYARQRYTEGEESVGVPVDWNTGDLAEDSEVPAGPFDFIVSAGNVLAFIPNAAHRQALGVLASRLDEAGRLVVGFGLQRGRSLEEFTEDATAAGLKVSQMFAGWDLQPFTEASDFLVAVLVRTEGGEQ
ncbi:MAG TPA: methyltransferase domain-containing protein [Candidatus Corynebacterium avicola]|uniref:Methyltransferase domain-containing protein n=1 Tax=Candidatus Corynebacterium avicola TaxID=2838527 RepID=A0A9D1RM78_9CORY|nr:methyltransferase domain-containing protein [Candidatus Corynebacterium avicola]